MQFGDVLTSYGVTVKTWNAQLFSEYLDKTFWKRFMGMDDGAIIHVNEDLSKKKGDKVTFNIRSEIIGGRVDGSAQGTGSEGAVEFYDFGVTVDEVRQLVKYKNKKMSNQRVAFDLLNSARPALSDKNRFNLEDDITTAMTTVGSERVRGKYLYGAADSNWDATHATALANVDNTNDKQSTTMVEDAKIKARVPTLAYAKVRPWQTKTGNQGGFQEWFVYVMHTYCSRDMVRNDASWKNAQLNIPPGTNMDSPIFTGSSFLGAWQGVLLYEWERVPIVSSTINVAHNLLMGAQAGVLAWAMHPEFGQDAEDVQHTQIFETDEIRGVAKTIWDRNTINSNISNEDNGVVNVFAAAVA